LWLKRLVLLSALIPWDVAVTMQLVRGVIPSPEFMAIPAGLITAYWVAPEFTRRRKANGDHDTVGR
jgi:hypothetical protein